MTFSLQFCHFLTGLTEFVKKLAGEPVALELRYAYRCSIWGVQSPVLGIHSGMLPW